MATLLESYKSLLTNYYYFLKCFIVESTLGYRDITKIRHFATLCPGIPI